MRISKIDLEEFINVLIDIYNEGADYIDIVSNIRKSQDIINIEVRKEYLHDYSEDESGELTDDVINKLI